MMKKGSIKTKIGAIVLSTMVVMGIIAYPGVIKPVDAVNATTTSLAVDQAFEAKIKNNNNGVVKDLPCTFVVTKNAADGKLGEVEVGMGSMVVISQDTVGEIEIPDVIMDVNTTEKYTVTSIGAGAFSSCKKLTSTGLEKNSTVTSIGTAAFYGCTGLTSTGLEKNSTVTTIGVSAFSRCENLASTGLEKNSTVTTIGNSAFMSCKNLTSTGLETNSTVKNVEYNAFSHCTGLTNIVFKIKKLPTLNKNYGGIFRDAGTGSGVNVYYLNGMENPEELNSCGANVSSVPIQVKNIVIKNKPKVTYVDGNTFDPRGLVVTVNYSANISEDIAYTSFIEDYFKFDKTTLTTSDNAVKVTCLGKEVNLPIKVEDKKVIDIKVKTAATKVNYIEDEIFNPKGLILTVAYEDGTSKDISYNDTTKADFRFDKTKLAVEDTKVVITYKEQKTTLPITVKEEVEINPDPSDPTPGNPNPTGPTDPSTSGTQVTTKDQKVKTNDSTGDISGIVLSLLVAGVVGVFLIKRKKDTKE